MILTYLPYILISIAFILEALMDASNFYKQSKIWNYIPIKNLNTPGAGMFKFDVFHLSKYIYIPCIFLAGFFTVEVTWYMILIIIGLRVVFFDRFLYIVKQWR